MLLFPPVYRLLVDCDDAWGDPVDLPKVLTCSPGWIANAELTPVPVIDDHVAADAELVVEVIEHINCGLVLVTVKPHQGKLLDLLRQVRHGVVEEAFDEDDVG